MNTLKDVVAFLIVNFPKAKLSNARLTKMVYLADWKSVLNTGNQLTTIEWYFDTYGPFVWDVHKVVEMNPETFSTSTISSMNGVLKRTVGIRDQHYRTSLSPEVKSILNHVLYQTSKLAWKDFIRLIYSTFPVAKSKQFESMDLKSLAEEYSR